jgi:hypothetical protein
LCATAILAGTVAGSVQYLTARPGAYAGESVVTLETTCTASVGHPRVAVTALLAITEWLSKPFDYIDQKLGSWARAVKAVLVGVAVAGAVLIVGGILVAVGAIAASGAAVAVLAVVAGIAAGWLYYALSKPPGGGKNEKDGGGDNKKPIPGPVEPLPDNVFLRVRWQPDPDEKKRDFAQQLFAYLDYRSKKDNGKESVKEVKATDFRQWPELLKKSLEEVKEDLLDGEINKKHVRLNTFPDPGSETLKTVRDLIRQVFGEWVVIEEGPPEQGKPQGQNPN